MLQNEKIQKGNRRDPQTHSRNGGRRVSPAWNRHVRHSRSDGCGRLNAWWILPAFRLQGTTRGRGYSRRSDTLLDTLASAASGKKGRNGLKAVSAAYVCAEHRDNPRDGCPLAALGSELARSDKRVRDVATTGFSRMVEILAAHFDQARPAEARKRA